MYIRMLIMSKRYVINVTLSNKYCYANPALIYVYLISRYICLFVQVVYSICMIFVTMITVNTSTYILQFLSHLMYFITCGVVTKVCYVH